MIAAKPNVVRIIAAMQLKGWGVRDTCINVGMNTKTLAKILKGEMPDRIGTLSRLCDGLKIPVQEALIGGPRAVSTYFVYSPRLEAVKIGRSVDPEKRLKAIKNGNPDELRLLGVINNDREKELHRRFAEYRTNREWFSMGPALMDFLKKELAVVLTA